MLRRLVADQFKRLGAEPFGAEDVEIRSVGMGRVARFSAEELAEAATTRGDASQYDFGTVVLPDDIGDTT